MSDPQSAASDALRRENERLRRDLARALKGQAVPGSGELVQPRRMDSVVTLRMDSDTLQALVELTEAHRTTRGEVIREAVRRMSNGHRMGPNTQGAWGVLILPKRAKRSSTE